MIKYLVICLQVLSYLGMGWGIKPLQAVDTPLCPSELVQEITTLIEEETWKRARWGIVIESQEMTLYSLASEQYFLPASTLKLLTTAAALTNLGPEFQIVTPIYTTGEAPNLTSLRIVGKGDPSLTTEDLESLVEKLKTQGVRSIENLIVEDNYFLDSSLNPTWEWFDLYYYYGVAANSLILNQNQVNLTIIPQSLGQPGALEWSDPVAARQWNLDNQTITTVEVTESPEVQGKLGERDLILAGEIAPGEEGSLDLAIADPGQYFLNSLDSLLLNQGIEVQKAELREQSTPPNLDQVMDNFTSLPLKDLIIPINQESNNLYAEALLKVVETETQQTLTELLTTLGIRADTYQIVDGSGLSRHNLVTPQTLVEALKIMDQSPLGQVYRESLSVPGVRGTLKNRFLGTSVVGNLWGKTGGMTGVASLAGYLSPPNYSPLVFTIIINQSSLSHKEMNQGIEQIILLLNRLSYCG